MFMVDQEQGPSSVASLLGPARGAGRIPWPPPRSFCPHGPSTAFIRWATVREIPRIVAVTSLWADECEVCAAYETMGV